MKASIHKKVPPKGRNGGILLMVLILVLVFSTLGLGILSLSQADALETAHILNQKKAFWLAEAGLHELRGIMDNKDNWGPLDTFDLVSADTNTPVLANNVESKGSYEVYIIDRGESGIVKIYDIRSVGRTSGGIASHTVRSELTLVTTADKVWATESENGINFATGDVIDGKMHSNDKLYINGKPIFKGKASSSANRLAYDDQDRGGQNSTYIDLEVFTQGLELGATEIDFDPDIIDNIKGSALTLAVSGTGPFKVAFDNNIYFLQEGLWSDTDNKWNWSSISTNFIDDIADTPGVKDNILFFQGDNTDVQLFVSGTVGGRVSLVTDGAIYIDDDITYASAPDPDHSQWTGDVDLDDNALGLFSKRKVEIDIPDPHGKDVNIHAAIFITEPDGSDKNWQFNPGFGDADRYNPIGAPNINLYGSIVQHDRGVVGTTGGDGYLKNYSHDSRFHLKPPPGTPYIPPLFERWSAGL